MSSTPIPVKRLLLALALSGNVGLSLGAFAAESPPHPATPVTQIARYSVIRPGPTPDQQDLLAMTAPRRLPDEIATVGDAVAWLLKPSGYRLAAPDRLSNEVKDLLNLPLPSAHREFEALPLTEVIALLVGPAFVLVQDPVHRLMAFEPCVDAGPTPEDSSPAKPPKPLRGRR
jgi:conjugative transfer region protein (TIGR03748 family)